MGTAGPLRRDGHRLDDGGHLRGARACPCPAAASCRRSTARRSQLAREVRPAQRRTRRRRAADAEDILDHRAFDNAITLLCAVGGSTNAIIHLLALAGRAGVPLPLDRFDEIAPPGAADRQRAARRRAPDRAADDRRRRARAAASELTPCSTWMRARSTGARSARSSTRAEVPTTRSSARSTIRCSPAEPLVVVRGNLAPDGAVIKAAPPTRGCSGTAAARSCSRMCRRLADRIDDPALDIDADTVLVLRNVGPDRRGRDARVGHAADPRASCWSAACATWCASPMRG